MRTGTVRRAIRRTAQAVVWVVVACLGYAALTAFQVWNAGSSGPVRPAGAIVVLGAAQYDGRPSPVLQARLEHAADLFRRDKASEIWVTGYKQPGDRSTEATAGARYLEGRGVPGNRIERITVGATTTYTTLFAAARELGQDEIGEVILVSDPYHSYRIAAIAEDLGLDAQVSAARDSPAEGSMRQLARETAAVSLGRLIGYRRLDRLDVLLQDAGLPGSGTR